MNALSKTLVLFVIGLTACTAELSDIKVSTPTISVYDYVTDPAYKSECLDINPTTFQSPVNFLGIYPGRTTSEQVKKLLGEPSKVFATAEGFNWFYDKNENIFISTIFIGNIVDRIDVVNQDKNHPSLDEIAGELGCPNLMTLVDQSEHSDGNYNMAVFIYPEIGVEYWFEFFGTKLTLESVATEIRYIKPIALEDYISSFNPFLSVNSPFIKPVFWKEIVLSK